MSCIYSAPVSSVCVQPQVVSSSCVFPSGISATCLVAVEYPTLDRFTVPFFSGSTGGNAIVATKTTTNPFNVPAVLTITDQTGVNPVYNLGFSADDDIKVTAPAGVSYFYGGASPQTWDASRGAGTRTYNAGIGESITIQLIDKLATFYQCNLLLSWSPP